MRVDDLPEAELSELARRCSNVGRWGPLDERGTLNLISPAKRQSAAALVPEGLSISLARVRTPGDLGVGLEMVELGDEGAWTCRDGGSDSVGTRLGQRERGARRYLHPRCPLECVRCPRSRVARAGRQRLLGGPCRCRIARRPDGRRRVMRSSSTAISRNVSGQPGRRTRRSTRAWPPRQSDGFGSGMSRSIPVTASRRYPPATATIRCRCT